MVTNWRRGLWRAWGAFSVLWVLAIAAFWWSGRSTYAFYMERELVVLAVAGPVALLIGGFAVRWIGRGFSPS
jgi:hypothetical protein